MSDLDTLNERKRKLLAELEELEKQEAEALAREKPAVVERIKAEIKKFSITAQELELTPESSNLAGTKATGKKATDKKGPAKPVKYRDPATGKEWTGHGKAPAWIKDATNRDVYLIKN